MEFFHDIKADDEDDDEDDDEEEEEPEKDESLETAPDALGFRHCRLRRGSHRFCCSSKGSGRGGFEG